MFFTGLMTKVEKSLSDHTEFLKCKKHLEEWLHDAHFIIQNCSTLSDEDNTKQQLTQINVSGIYFCMCLNAFC